MQQDNYKFNKPVIILAAPRSGSTLLFELLSQAKNAWTIGDESHAIFESIAKFSPNSGLCHSNRLEAADADAENVATIRQRFYSQLRDREAVMYNDALEAPRFLEKTPKNSLRVPFLNEIFPDALYIYLYRNPRDNISSIMDAWKSQRYVTYASLKGRESGWSLLLPPDWEAMHDKPLEELASFQWERTNAIIMNDLQTLIPKDRWMTVSYSNVVNKTESVIKELCEFSDLGFDAHLQDICRAKLKMSRYTLSQPSSTKWHKHAVALSRVMASTQPTLDKLRQLTLSASEEDFDIHIPEHLSQPHKVNIKTEVTATPSKKVGRNTACPCGSGLKYKRCHGKI